MTYEQEFLRALFLTIAIETAGLFVAVRLVLRQGAKIVPVWKIVFLGALCSGATLPYLWFVLPSCLQPYWVLVIIGEFLVVMIEGVVYYFILECGFRRALGISLFCNLLSFLAGLFLGHH